MFIIKAIKLSNRKTYLKVIGTYILVLLNTLCFAKSYQYFGLQFEIDDNYKQNEYSYGNEIIKIGSAPYYSVSFVPSSKVNKVIDLEDKSAFTPSLSFNEQFLDTHFNGKYKTYYVSKLVKRKEQLSAYLVLNISPSLKMVFKTETSYSFNEHIELLNSILASVKKADKDKEQLAKNSIDWIQFKVFETIGDQYIKAQSGTTGPRLKDGINDELIMIWADVNNKHFVTRLDKNGKVQKETCFGDTAVYDVVAHNDGLAILLSPPTILNNANRYHHLYLNKYSWNGEELFSTHLMGVDDIKKVGDQRFAFWGESSTRLAWSGEYYAAFFATYRKWPDLVTHQADAYLIADKNGVLMDQHDSLKDASCTWCVSHSFGQEMIFNGKSFVRFSLGDAYPRSILMTNSYPYYGYNSSNNWSDNFAKFPGEDGDNYVYDTNFGNIALDGKYTYFVFDTELNAGGIPLNGYGNKRCNDIFLYKIKEQNKTNTVRLSNSSSIEERYASLAVLDTGLLLIKYQKYDPKQKGVKTSVSSGSVSEMIGIYNIENKKWLEKRKLKIDFDGKETGDFSLSSEGKNYHPFHGTDGKLFQSSQLFTDMVGNIWFIRFKINQPGFELIQVSIAE